jgi:hypothetical protein
MKERSYLCNRLWRLIGLWDVKARTISRQSAHRWRWGCQPYALAAFTPGRFLVLISVKSLSRPQGHSATGRTRSILKPNDLIGNRFRNLLACMLNILRRLCPVKDFEVLRVVTPRDLVGIHWCCEEERHFHLQSCFLTLKIYSQRWFGEPCWRRVYSDFMRKTTMWITFW